MDIPISVETFVPKTGKAAAKKIITVGKNSSSTIKKSSKSSVANKNLSCIYCDKPFYKRYNLIRHIRTHTNEKPFACSFCQKAFNERSRLFEHMKSHTDSKLFPCFRCENYYTEKESLDEHMATAHNKKIPKSNLPPAPVTSSSILPGGSSNLSKNEKAYPCTVCDKSFTRKDNLVKHFQHHEVKIINKEAEVQKNVGFTCVYCGDEFLERSKLLAHIGAVHISKPLPCLNCDNFFTKNEDLIKHMETHKTGDRPFPCKFCTKSFIRKDHLIRHYKTHAVNDKPYLCSYCKKGFYKRYRLIEHIKTHTNERPFPCSYCNLFFPRKEALVEHMLSHAEERPHYCNICDKHFKRKKYLQRHLKRQHNGGVVKEPKNYYTASMIANNYQNGNLDNGNGFENLPKNIADSANFYACAYCDKYFTHTEFFNEHMSTHANEIDHFLVGLAR